MSSPKINGQLSTPSLSPIQEIGPQDVPSLDSSVQVGGEADPVVADDVAKDRGTSEATDRRRSSDVKTRKLSSQQVCALLQSLHSSHVIDHSNDN